MPTAKEMVINYIKSLPDDLTVEEIAYKIYIDERINKARKQIKEGKYLNHEEAKERLRKWLI
ncbi:MAG: hypothetical protein EU551_03980 [Promethearchaeota archaeon]|nr:MAG: hypothetical protein EU551_03980 [Candidatus Lokiarchaeota archaeon]